MKRKKKTCIYIPALQDMNPLICTIQLNSFILRKDAWNLEWARNSFTWRQVHRDIVNAIRCLKLDKKEQNPNLVVEQAYVQILLARSIPAFNLQEKSSVESNDIIYQTVSYIAKHFKEEMSLEKMARDMGVSKFTLSRVFSGTFHRNFNQYLNEQRLNYVCVHLECTDKSITDISMDAGFESQRTFNRVFRERYKMTPREYRNLYREKFVLQNEII